MPPKDGFPSLSARVATAAAAAAMLLFAACGGSSGGSGSSVEDELGFNSAGLLERQVVVENLLRDCMRAQGFEYVPVDPAAQRTALTGTANLTEEEFERQYGYGLTTLYERRVSQSAAGPNVATRNSLSPAQRTAYDRALFGANIGVTFDVAADQGEYGQLGGCTKEATEQSFGGPELLRTMASKLDELDARILADPLMVKAVTQWRDCMRVDGYELADPDQVDVVLKRRLEQIVGPPDRAVVPGTAATAPYDKGALLALQREEVAMVAADIACERRHISPVEDKVREQYERTFREQNASLLARVPRP